MIINEPFYLLLNNNKYLEKKYFYRDFIFHTNKNLCQITFIYVTCYIRNKVINLLRNNQKNQNELHSLKFSNYFGSINNNTIFTNLSIEY